MTNETNRAAASRRARSDFDGYADSVLLNEREAAAVSGFSHNTLKFWRLTGKEKGPRPVYLHGMVRYEVGEIRRWRTETLTNISANTRDSTDQNSVSEAEKS
jgi:predicted DNA-binding transcriptional regulator AlpA